MGKLDFCAEVTWISGCLGPDPQCVAKAAIGPMVSKNGRSEVGPISVDFCTEVTRKMAHLEEASGGLRRDMRLSKVHVHVRKFKAPHRKVPMG